MNFGNATILRETIASAVAEGGAGVVSLSMDGPAASVGSATSGGTPPSLGSGPYVTATEDADAVAVARTPRARAAAVEAQSTAPCAPPPHADFAPAAAAAAGSAAAAAASAGRRRADPRRGDGGLASALAPRVHAVIVDGSRVSTIDLTACVALREAIEAVRGRGHVVAMCGFPDRPLGVMRAFGLIEMLQPPAMAPNVTSALDAVRPLLAV